MLKRMISFFLCAVMLLSMLPVQIIALETEAPIEAVLETEPAAEETEATEGETEPTEETTAPTEAETVPVEEVPDSEETESPPEPIQMDLGESDYDSAELLMGFLSPLYTGGEASTFGTLAADRLSAANRFLYDGLKAQIIDIAQGNRESTQISVDFTGKGFSFAELDVGLVMLSLWHDCPYELYWHKGISVYSEGWVIIYDMYPHNYYQPDNYNEANPTVDTVKTKHAADAAKNIYSIKTQYEAYADYEKLCAYADEICALVEYDYGALVEGVYEENMTPWTLVNVFDGDPSTNVVCEGYAEAFQYLCDESTFRGNVECYSASGNEHKWNIVRMEGVSYLMDVTHCDNDPTGIVALRGPKFFGGGEGSVTEGYQIGGFHYWYDEYTLPVFGDGEDSILKLSPTKYVPPETYLIVYDANGGSGAPNSQRKTQGIAMTLREEIPVRAGYQFLGWAATSSATEATYQPGDSYSAEGDAVLYAVWKEVVCAHEFGSYSVTKTPGCEKTGVEERSCTLCGETESREVPATGHSEKTLEKVPATCTEDGLTEGSICTACGETLTKQEVIPAGHTIQSGICVMCNAYGTCGNQLTWTYDTKTATLTISGTGAMNGYMSSAPAPWYCHRESIQNVIVEDGVTRLGNNAFLNCSGIKGITLPAALPSIPKTALLNCNGLTDIYIADISSWAESSNSAILNCNSLAKNLYLDDKLVVDLIVPEGTEKIGDWAFANCAQISSVTLPETITQIGANAFLTHAETDGLEKITFTGNAPTFAETAFSGTAATAYYPANNATWISDVMQNYGGTITWLSYGAVENQITIPVEELAGQTSAWIDGREYTVNTDGGMPSVDLPNSKAKTMITYTYGESNGKPYPTGMKVWTLTNEDGIYTAQRVEELDDMLGYAGCSIRIDGKQGIRMITSIEEVDKDALTGNGLADYKLKEYGTAIAWASQLGRNKPLVLGKSYVRHNYAYNKETGDDPTYNEYEGRMYYTNVLVGFELDQCKDDLAMRPYMILEDAEGNEITLYGGIVERSIGHIASVIQNQEEYAPDSLEHKYLQTIIEASSEAN